VPPSAHRQAVLLLITVVLAWGFVWPVNKVILATLPPLWSVVARSAIATVALFALMLARGRLAWPPREDLPVLVGITLLHMVGFTALSTWGLALVPAGRSVVLAYTTPIWVAPGARLVLGEALTARRMVGVAIGLAGLAVLFNPEALDWTDGRLVLGNLAILAAALLWATSILHIRAHRWRSTPLDLVPWETLLATVILAPLALATTPLPRIEWSAPLVLMLLYAGIPGTALAYWAVAMASRDLPAVTTSLGLLATPVVSVVVATLWLGEPLTLSLAAAIVLILGGVAIGATGGATHVTPRAARSAR
jgi:drug/metabolite transporter (DMT)-like permease